jgi:hypothetical protein
MLSDVAREVWAAERLAQGFDGRTEARWSSNGGFAQNERYCVVLETPCADLITVAWFDPSSLERHARFGIDARLAVESVDRWLREVRMHHAFQLPAEWLGAQR